MKRVAMIGAGLIGRSWAIVFARAGWTVSLYRSGRRRRRRRDARSLRRSLTALAKLRLVDDPKAAAARVSAAKTLEQAVDGADFVQENGPEDVDAEDRDLRQARRGCAAPTPSSPPPPRRSSRRASPKSCKAASAAWSRIRSIRRILCRSSSCAARPGPARTTIARARAIYESIGQVPVTVRREVDGFILNRLQGALLAEAFRLVGEGYVSPQDLDHTIKDGLGLRWSFMGPFETIELNAPGGIPDYCARYTGFYKRLQAAPATPEAYSDTSVSEIVTQWGHAATPERISKRMQWRDGRLAALAAHKKTQPPS